MHRNPVKGAFASLFCLADVGRASIVIQQAMPKAIGSFVL